MNEPNEQALRLALEEIDVHAKRVTSCGALLRAAWTNVALLFLLWAALGGIVLLPIVLAAENLWGWAGLTFLGLAGFWSLQGALREARELRQERREAQARLEEAFATASRLEDLCPSIPPELRRVARAKLVHARDHLPP